MLCWASPPVVHQHSPAEGAEALMDLTGAWPDQQGTSQGSGSHPDSPPMAGSWCFLQPACEGLRERAGQARAWGCQGREKSLGLNENKLFSSNDFIPYLLLSATQSLPCFYPAEAAKVLFQWLFE